MVNSQTSTSKGAKHLIVNLFQEQAFIKQERNNLIVLAWIIFLIVFGWNCIGCLIEAPVENDGIRIGFGCELIERKGIDAVKSLCYRYDVQPGTYMLSVWVQKITHLNGLDNFSLLSKIVGIFGTLISCYVISIVCKIPFPVTGLIGMTFQEFFVNNYYPNSNAFANTFYMLALLILLLSKAKSWIMGAGILFAMAIWMRLDVGIQLFMFLAILYVPKNFKFSLINYFYFGIPSIIMLTILLYISHVNIFDIYETTKTHMDGDFGGKEKYLGLGMYEWGSYLSYFSVLNIYVLLIGCYYLIKTESYRILMVSIVGFIPLFLFYFGNLSTPKYLFYGIVPIIIVVTEGWKFLIHNKSKIGLSFILLLFLCQYIFFGLKAYESNNLSLNIGNFVVMGSKKQLKEKLSNYLLQTADGKRLSSGTMILPVLWFLKKKEQNSKYQVLSDRIAEKLNQDSLEIYTNDEYENTSLIFNILVNKEYEPTSIGQSHYAFIKENQKVSFFITQNKESFKNLKPIFERSVFINL